MSTFWDAIQTIFATIGAAFLIGIIVAIPTYMFMAAVKIARRS